MRVTNDGLNILSLVREEFGCPSICTVLTV